jgi:hypothetical protein
MQNSFGTSSFGLEEPSQMGFAPLEPKNRVTISEFKLRQLSFGQVNTEQVYVFPKFYQTDNKQLQHFTRLKNLRKDGIEQFRRSQNNTKKLWVTKEQAHHNSLLRNSKFNLNQFSQYLRPSTQGMHKISIDEDFLAPNAFWNSRQYLIKRKTIREKNFSKGQTKLAQPDDIKKEGFFCEVKSKTGRGRGRRKKKGKAGKKAFPPNLGSTRRDANANLQNLVRRLGRKQRRQKRRERKRFRKLIKNDKMPFGPMRKLYLGVKKRNQSVKSIIWNGCSDRNITACQLSNKNEKAFMQPYY